MGKLRPASGPRLDFAGDRRSRRPEGPDRRRTGRARPARPVALPVPRRPQPEPRPARGRPAVQVLGVRGGRFGPRLGHAARPGRRRRGRPPARPEHPGAGIAAKAAPRHRPRAARRIDPYRPRPPRRSPGVDREWQAAADRSIRGAEALLWSAEGRDALAWLRARGLADHTIRRFRLGFSADGMAGRSAPRGIVIPCGHAGGMAPASRPKVGRAPDGRRARGRPVAALVRGQRPPAHAGRLRTVGPAPTSASRSPGRPAGTPTHGPTYARRRLPDRRGRDRRAARVPGDRPRGQRRHGRRRRTRPTARDALGPGRLPALADRDRHGRRGRPRLGRLAKAQAGSGAAGCRSPSARTSATSSRPGATSADGSTPRFGPALGLE